MFRSLGCGIRSGAPKIARPRGVVRLNYDSNILLVCPVVGQNPIAAVDARSAMPIMAVIGHAQGHPEAGARSRVLARVDRAAGSKTVARAPIAQPSRQHPGRPCSRPPPPPSPGVASEG